MNLNQTFAILFRLNYSKANSKGLVPIWTRITIDGQRAECSTGKQVEPKHWKIVPVFYFQKQHYGWHFLFALRQDSAPPGNYQVITT